jgi:AcrR family transcriptional regulator
MKRPSTKQLPDALLDAAEAVVARQGIASLTIDAVAAEAGMSKGGVLHHFPSKDRLVEAMVVRSAEGWRAHFSRAYELMPPGPGRMARALLHHCLSGTKGWTRDLQRGSSACFAALAQNPSLIAPMREVYSDLQERLAHDGLPPGVGEAVGATINGLWLYWVLGLVPVNQQLIAKVRLALEDVLAHTLESRLARSAKPPLNKSKPSNDKSARASGRRVRARSAGGAHS